MQSEEEANGEDIANGEASVNSSCGHRLLNGGFNVGGHIGGWFG